jgi:hypothetical protein
VQAHKSAQTHDTAHGVVRSMSLLGIE